MAKWNQSVRTALRGLVRRPGSSLISVATLALGIGANTAIFSLLNAIVFRPLPVPHPEQLVALATTIADDVNGSQPLSLAMFQELARSRTGVTDLFAWNAGGVSNFEAKGRNFAGLLAKVSGGYYGAMRIQPLLGRFISPADVALNSGTSNAVAVISYRAWRSVYQADRHIIGKVIHIEKIPFTIIGVEPDGYSGLIIDGSADITVPVLAPGQTGRQDMRNPRLLWLTAYGRLETGVTLAQARARLAAEWPQIQRATMPPGYDGARKTRFFARRITLESAASGVSYLRQRFSYSLRVLLALVGTVLLIACLNLANLSLAKGAARQHETGVRAALGASLWNLTSQPLIEGLMLSFSGALLGLGLAYWMSEGLLKLAWTGLFATPLSTKPDIRVLGFTALTAVGTGLLFALAPAWFAARTNPVVALKNGTRSIRSGSNTLSRMFLLAQIALSLTLVVGALLFGETLRALHNTDLGYRRDHFLTMLLFPQPGRIPNNNSGAYFKALAENLRRLPGVSGVSFSSLGPADEFEGLAPVYASRSFPPVQAIGDFAGPDFFATAGMHILSGREFRWQDEEEKQEIVIISESLAEKLFGHENAVGRRISMFPVSYGEEATVVGVVNSASLWKVESRKPMAFFQPFTKTWNDADPLVDIRTTVDPRSIKAAAEQVVRSMGHHYSLRTMTVNERLDSYITVQRITAMLAGWFSAVALLIAAIGLYGLTSFQVTQRTAELGIRMALGAQRGQILSSVLRDTCVLAGGGCLIGLAASLALGRLVRSLLFGVSAADPVILISAMGLLLVVAAAASVVPARRAASVDPMRALRVE